MESISFLIGAGVACVFAGALGSSTSRQTLFRVYKYLPWKWRAIRIAVLKDRTRSQLVSAKYLVEMLQEGNEEQSLAQMELLHRLEGNLKTINKALDELFPQIDESLAGLGINEPEQKNPAQKLRGFWNKS